MWQVNHLKIQKYLPTEDKLQKEDYGKLKYMKVSQ